MAKIEEKSWISLSLAIAVIGGGAAWMTRQELQTSANAAKIDDVQHVVKETKDSLISIDKRLSVIEQILKRIDGKE